MISAMERLETGALTETLQLLLSDDISIPAIELIEVAAAAEAVDDMAMVIDDDAVAVMDMPDIPDMPDMELISIFDRRVGTRVSGSSADESSTGEEQLRKSER